MDSRLFHIALAGDWRAAQRVGEYRVSTRGRSLDDVGFIHASYARQVGFVANAYYAGVDDLLLLVIDGARLGAEVRDEAVAAAMPAAGAPSGSAGTPSGSAGGEHDVFPHIYGPLNVDAVTEVVPLVAGADGRFALPPRFNG
jgi:glutathione S-transferase